MKYIPNVCNLGKWPKQVEMLFWLSSTVSPTDGGAWTGEMKTLQRFFHPKYLQDWAGDPPLKCAPPHPYLYLLYSTAHRTVYLILLGRNANIWLYCPLCWDPDCVIIFLLLFRVYGVCLQKLWFGLVFIALGDFYIVFGLETQSDLATPLNRSVVCPVLLQNYQSGIILSWILSSSY